MELDGAGSLGPRNGGFGEAVRGKRFLDPDWLIPIPTFKGVETLETLVRGAGD